MVQKLNNEQTAAIKTDGCSLLIVAGAGTGKTRVLVEKVVHLLSLGVSGDAVLALTFTNKAADEMRGRIHARFTFENLPFVGTFHALCVSLLREFHDAACVPAQFSIFDREACKRVLKRCMKEITTDSTPRVMQHAVGQLKTGNGDNIPDQVFHSAEQLLPLYQIALEQEGALDFDDLLLKTIQLLEENEQIRERIQSRYSYILVDEFQDTDGLQNRLITLLKSSQSCIIAVGDTDQTIYSWRGATVDSMLFFTESYPPAEVVILTQNYRSSGNILAAANAVISKNIFRQKKELHSTRTDGDLIALLSAKDEEEEAEKIAQKIIHIHKNGIPYTDIAILFRANFQARALETHMLTHRIPYTVLGARFFDRAEIKDLVAYLSLIHNPSSREAFVRAVAAPRRGIGARTIEKIFTNEERLLSNSAAEKIASFRLILSRITALAEEKPVGSVLQELIQLLEYKKHLEKTFDNPDERFYEVRELINFAERFSHLSGKEGIANLLSEIALSSDQDTLRVNERKDAVRLMTIHAAKGLEFSHVFITGMEEGLFPFSFDEYTTHDKEEERRLCYVAMTRAKDMLYCSFADRRGIFGNYRQSRPSSFLYDIPKHLIASISEKILYKEGSGEKSIEW